MDFIKRHFFKIESRADNDPESISSLSHQGISRSNQIPSREVQQKIMDSLKGKYLDISKIKKILEEDKHSIHAKDKYGNSVLHLTIDKMDNENDEHIQFIRYLLEKGADPCCNSSGGHTPFIRASWKNKFEAIEILAEWPENNVNGVTENGDSALHFAVEGDHVETVALLHQLAKTHGLNENIRSESSKMTPLELAISKNNKNEKIIKILETNLEEYDAKKFGYGLRKSIERYKMSAKPRGLCVIFQNDTFNDSSMDRTGCYDAELLKKSFTDLGFKVIEEPNLRAVEMYEKILNYSKMDEHSQYDCFVLCISSHGNANGVFGIDGNTLAVKDVTSLFAGPICENLRGKPKLFFISACRNEERNKAEMKEEREMDDAATSDGSSPYSFESGAKKRSALEDIYEGYSTPHGFKSHRELLDGGADKCVSIYIDELCKTLNDYGTTVEFQQMMLMVNKRVRERNFYVPSPVNRLTQQLWFKDL